MKHLSLIAAIAMAVALPTTLVAQERAGERSEGQQAQAQGDARQAGPQLSADAHHVIDKKAVNAQGKDIGKIKDVLIGQDGRVQALIVDVKGKSRALPWDQVAMKGDQLTVNMNDQQLSQLPEYRGEHD